METLDLDGHIIQIQTVNSISRHLLGQQTFFSQVDAPKSQKSLHLEYISKVGTSKPYILVHLQYISEVCARTSHRLAHLHLKGPRAYTSRLSRCNFYIEELYKVPIWSWMLACAGQL